MASDEHQQQDLEVLRAINRASGGGTINRPDGCSTAQIYESIGRLREAGDLTITHTGELSNIAELSNLNVYLVVTSQGLKRLAA